MRLIIVLSIISISSCLSLKAKISQANNIDPNVFQYVVAGNPLKKLKLVIQAPERNANLSLKASNEILLDNLAIPNKGQHELEVLIDFRTTGEKSLQWLKRGGKINILRYEFSDVSDLETPHFKDISQSTGLVTEPSWKYGGPTIADVDNNGYYDLILNNHDKVATQLFLQKEKGKLIEEQLFPSIADFHGTAAGDYDNDGDLDIANSRGGGNGTTPSPPFLLRNEQGEFKEVASEVGITNGARGRSVRWIDMDLDGDLDLLAVNAEGINSTDTVQHLFYKNNGNGQFETVRSPNVENAKAERVVVTDINNDQIDDLVLYTPLSIWKGNGDFTYTDVSAQWLSEDLQELDLINAITDIDIDNDGDLDFYLARGKTHYQIANKSLNFNPQTGKMDIRDEGNKAITSLEFEADAAIVFSEVFLWYRLYDDGFPLHLGSEKAIFKVGGTGRNGDTLGLKSLKITPEMATGWPVERTQNGWYLGYLGNQKWRLEWVRNKPIYWGIRFSIEGIHSVTPLGWQPQNTNVQDILLKNEGGKFVDISEEWNIPKGGNHWGVTVGDFNNDSYQDLYVYRFGFLKERVTDWLVLNTGKGRFENTTAHAAKDLNDKGHGDMGQAFDFDLDGQVDLLSGSDDPGKWYLYGNQGSKNNYVLVKVGYSPKSNIDPYSAVVTVETADGTYQKRVGSAGEVHSQSLLNTVHFGLGTATSIRTVRIRWRNGEERVFRDVGVNRVLE